jgi:hypothetical protein
MENIFCLNKLSKFIDNLPIPAAALSKVWNVFARSNTEIVGSNLTQAMDVCFCVICVCVR